MQSTCKTKLRFLQKLRRHVLSDKLFFNVTFSWNPVSSKFSNRNHVPVAIISQKIHHALSVFIFGKILLQRSVNKIQNVINIQKKPVFQLFHQIFSFVVAFQNIVDISFLSSVRCLSMPFGSESAVRPQGSDLYEEETSQVPPWLGTCRPFRVRLAHFVLVTSDRPRHPSSILPSSFYDLNPLIFNSFVGVFWEPSCSVLRTRFRCPTFEPHGG